MTRKQKRLAFIGAGVGIFALAVALALSAVSQSLMFFYSPSDVAQKGVADGTKIRLGGLVETGSVERGEALAVRFTVTDGPHAVPVAYIGILPDLFREGQGVVVEGAFDNGLFRASLVLARHDETYMAPEVADALKRAGTWRGEAGEALPAGAITKRPGAADPAAADSGEPADGGAGY